MEENEHQQFGGGTVESAINEKDGRQHFENTEKSFSFQDNNFFDERIRDARAKSSGFGRSSQPEPPDDPSDNISKKFIKLDDKIKKSDDRMIRLDRRRGVVKKTAFKLGNTPVATLKVRLKEGRLSDQNKYVRKRRLESRKHFEEKFYEKNEKHFEKAAEWEGKHPGKLYTSDRHKRLKTVSPIGKTYETATQKDYSSHLFRKTVKGAKKRAAGRLIFNKTKDAFDDKNLQTDEVAEEMSKNAKQTGRLYFSGERMVIRTFKRNNSVYARFDLEQRHNEILKEQKNRLINKETEKQLKKDLQSEQNKKVKKQMIQYYHQQTEGSFFRRTANTTRYHAKKVKQTAAVTKRVVTNILAAVGAACFLVIFLIIILIVVLCITDGASSIGTSFISMNDYSTMTSVTNYFNDLCTNLDIYLNTDISESEEETETQFEKDTKAEYSAKGTSIYEFIYKINDDITYNQIDLVAYLSAKYGSFYLDEEVKKEMDEIFGKMFVVKKEIKEEARYVWVDGDPLDPKDKGGYEWQNKNICYVTLDVTDFDEVIDDRMDEGQKNSYTGYRLSSCGQQIFSPILKTDWTNLISSPFGSRYHPIHKEYRMHNGTDIAVPTGTKVYSAVKGEVVSATYSDSAGYMVSITDHNGYTVTYMHLSSYSVAEGQKIEAGEMIALSGNTGASTGPHLHVEVQDPEKNYLNPIFIIPQTYVVEN